MMANGRWLTILILLLVPLAGALMPTDSAAQLAPRLEPREAPLPLDGREQPLPQDQAFPWFVSLEGPGQVTVTWQPAPAHYLYRHQFQFTLLPAGDGAMIPLDAQLPAGLQKTDEFFGDIEAYYDLVKASLRIDPEKMAGAQLEIQFQGCADWGFCYPPKKVTVPLQP